ncbi:MAG: NAD(P)H-dependent oxidoreductase [Gammaproteobacteria bacterium]|nr:NAD(P)H-dependent oxidoreductase [Gammaproteobacteria bacterium]
MKRILHVRSSLFADASASNQLADEYLLQFTAKFPHGDITTLDLAKQPLPHLSEAEFTAWQVPEAQRTPEQHERAALSDRLIDQLFAHDTLVLGVPMYNLGIPSTLKAWIDRIARAGKTFRYTADGPQGLVQGRTAHLLFTRGGEYRGTPLDTQTGHLQSVLGLIGITAIQNVYAEGLNMGETRREQGLAEARDAMQALLAEAA